MNILRDCDVLEYVLLWYKGGVGNVFEIVEKEKRLAGKARIKKKMLQTRGNTLALTGT